MLPILKNELALTMVGGFDHLVVALSGDKDNGLFEQRPSIGGSVALINATGQLSARTVGDVLQHADSKVVPEAGIEPACLAARDFLATSTFAASVMDAVRGLEHAFTLAFRP